jgi:hypothetical protein
MLKDIIAVQPLKRYQLHLTFEDRKEGIIDLAEIIEFSGIFEPLKNPAYFATVHVGSRPGNHLLGQRRRTRSRGFVC